MIIKKVYSFDVFDTVLVRTWSKPTDLFWELASDLQQHNLISISAREWSCLRVKSEQNARRNSSSGEISLHTIYKVLSLKLNWSQAEAEQAIQQEIQLELESLRLVPETARLINDLHQSGEGVLYLSDMYLSYDVIKLFLEKNGIWKDIDKLYVSSEIGSNKSSGELFRHCLKEESLNADQMIHLGDNIISDVKVPLSLNIKSKHFSETQLNRYENQIYRSTNLPLKFRSLLAGSSRLTRLKHKGSSKHQEILWNTSSSVVAPVLFGFVYWCMKGARKLGIKKLYFVARDGQVLLKIAKVISKNWDYSDIECRYLYGSRQAWHFPAIQRIGQNELDWLFDPTSFLSVKSVCARVNLEPAQIIDCLISQGFPESSWEKNLDKAERNLLKEVFLDTETEKLIVSIASEYCKQAIGYFQQEGINDGDKFGLVDIGWNGRLQRSFSNLLAANSMYPDGGVYGFYFGLSRRLKACPTDELLTYFCDVSGAWQRDAFINKALLEVFVAADHGGTSKFQKIDGRYSPVLRSENNDSAINWGLTLQQDAVDFFAHQLTQNLQPEDCKIEHFVKASEMILRTMTMFPSQDEANVFGSFQTTEDQNDSISYDLSPVLGINDFLSLITINRKPHNNAWLSASFARNPNISRMQKNILQCFVASRNIIAVCQRKIFAMANK